MAGQHLGNGVLEDHMQVALDQEFFSRRMVSSTWELPRRPMIPILRNCSMVLLQGSAAG